MKKKKQALNALQVAQLKDCINAGMTAPKIRKGKPGQAIKAAPLFGQPSASDFKQQDLF